MTKGQSKFDNVMQEWEHGKLHSSSGELIKHPSGHKQALAIAFKEARLVDAQYGLAEGGKLNKISDKVYDLYSMIEFYISKHYSRWNRNDTKETQKIRHDFGIIKEDYGQFEDTSVGIFLKDWSEYTTDELKHFEEDLNSFVAYYDLDKKEMQSDWDKVKDLPDYEPELEDDDYPVLEDMDYAKGGNIKIDLIRKIKNVTSEYGNITTEDLELASSPVYDSREENDYDYELIEGFNENDVRVVCYIDEQEDDVKIVPYKDLKTSELKEIYHAIKDWEGKAYSKGGRTRYDKGGVTEKEKLQIRIDTIKKQLADPTTVEMVKKNMEMMLPLLEKKLENYKESQSVSETPPVKQVEKPKKEKSEVREILGKTPIVEQVMEKQVQAEKPKKVIVEKVEEKERVGGKEQVKAHIEGTIEGEFEGTIETEGGKPVKIKEKVSVEVESTPTAKKPQRNVSVPADKPYWVDIEEDFKETMRSATGAMKIDKTTKTFGDKYRIYVDSQEVLDKVVNLYNVKRSKKKLPLVSASDISGKHAKGGKIWSKKVVKKEESLRSKARRMGLINKKERLSETDLNKLEQQGPKWKKIVASYKKQKK